MVKGVLLDMDGTLVLSNDAHALAWVEAFAHHGYTIDYEAVRPLIGMGGDKLMPRLVPDLDKNSGPGKAIGEFRTKLFLHKYAPGLQPAPGTRELVQRLQADGFKLIVASSAKDEELEVLLKVAKVDDLLKLSTTSSDTDGSKPEPDIVQAALDKLGMFGQETIMLGDTPYDVEAASASGVPLVAVRCGGFSDQDLAGAEAIYDSPADLLDHYDSSLFVG